MKNTLFILASLLAFSVLASAEVSSDPETACVDKLSVKEKTACCKEHFTDIKTQITCVKAKAKDNTNANPAAGASQSAPAE